MLEGSARDGDTGRRHATADDESGGCSIRLPGEHPCLHDGRVPGAGEEGRGSRGERPETGHGSHVRAHAGLGTTGRGEEIIWSQVAIYNNGHVRMLLYQRQETE